jgi:hypothetical protein
LNIIIKAACLQIPANFHENFENVLEKIYCDLNKEKNLHIATVVRGNGMSKVNNLNHSATDIMSLALSRNPCDQCRPRCSTLIAISEIFPKIFPKMTNGIAQIKGCKSPFKIYSMVKNKACYYNFK